MTRTARFAALAIAFVALVTLIVHVRLGLAARPDWPLWRELWRTGRFFTVLTVALVAVHFLWVGLSGRASAALAGGVTLWIGIVGAVYHALLWRPLEGLRLYVDHSMHSLLPVLVAAWWLACAPKGALRPAHAAWWLGWPGLYVAYVLARGMTDGRYPYFFVDPGRIGWLMVGVWVLALGAVFWLGGVGLVRLGRWLSRSRDPVIG
ncbi:hypothetical protein ROJ8625_00813 [Roseivivax jejudonensis]|uniref:FAR-17a/AIG1-like protein n=1 Tax=Roseivivax jejudonensis TaxID=1529041 RepID=A0A1X6YHA5_9RHOB|nr:Pr6Pr family membrane protein [Roseivivax jejudonensis]SLN21495.1 hypothetical protein ROJ8625_00813 [Roseivivax jejudonensis]